MHISTAHDNVLKRLVLVGKQSQPQGDPAHYGKTKKTRKYSHFTRWNQWILLANILKLYIDHQNKYWFIIKKNGFHILTLEVHLSYLILLVSSHYLQLLLNLLCGPLGKITCVQYEFILALWPLSFGLYCYNSGAFFCKKKLLVKGKVLSQLVILRPLGPLGVWGPESFFSFWSSPGSLRPVSYWKLAIYFAFCPCFIHIIIQWNSRCCFERVF